MSNQDGKFVQQAHQGDVFIRRVNAVPKSATKGKGVAILANGEQTGHAHAVRTKVVHFRDDGLAAIYVETKPKGEAAAVTHEEHAPVHLSDGVFEAIRQSEYSPVEIIRVED